MKIYQSEKRIDAYEIYRECHLAKDTSKAKFECVKRIDEENLRESTLWRGKLPDQTDLFVASLRAPVGLPSYDRGFIDENEAVSFFARATRNMS